MSFSGTRHGCHRAAASAALGALLMVVAAAPAHAETIREQQWHLDAMKAERMWQSSTGKGITVAVIDSGVDPDNPDLKGRVLPGKDFLPDEPGDEHTDTSGHGTEMAGVIAATGAWGGGRGAFGLAPGVKILPVRVPTGGAAANQAEGIRRFNEVVPKAIRFAVDEGAQVINVSLGVDSGSRQLTDAVTYGLEHGSLIFAAVGNSGDEANVPQYPSATPGVVGVAAVGENLRSTQESQYGPQVDMAAPGEDIVSVCGSKTGLCRSHGSSDATALASASAALIWSAHLDWNNNQVLRVMLNTIGGPTDGAERNDSIGYGIVRPRIALLDPGGPGPADEYPLPDFKAAVPVSPPAGATGTGAASGGSQNATPGAQEAKPHSENGMPWPAVGVGAAVVVGGVFVALVVFRRRKRDAVHLPATASSQFPYATQAFGPPPIKPEQVRPPGRGPDEG